MTAQQKFEREYITSSEICKRLRVTRATITQGKSKGWLPDEINVDNHLLIWERNQIEPFLVEWEKRRNERIGVV